MRKSLTKNVQKGFTLIELVVVIVILGILAATALPRFTNMSGTARIATLNGMVGALNSAISVTHGQFLVTSPLTSPVSMDGANVVVWGGYPDAGAAGIGAALTSYSGFTFAPGTAATSASTAMFTIQANCLVTYTAATSTSTTATATVVPTVTTTTTGC
jgi:MSHA pilin protein MshA